MDWRLVTFEIIANDLFDVRISNGSIEIELLGFADINGPTATLSGCHIQGPGPNTADRSMLRQIAEWVMELLDVDELRIEGATRTSGTNPGRRPTPCIFRRTCHTVPSA